MDITRLRYFERVARLASFTRAAEDLHVAQPALSKQIAALEHEIGDRLFERIGGHTIILTETGKRLLLHTEAVLEAFVRLETDLVAPNGTAHTQLQIGASPSFVETLLAGVIADCVRLHPSVQVVVKTGLITSLTDDLVEGRLDAAIGVLPNMHRLLRDELLFEEEYVLLVPSEHEWASRRQVDFAELRDQPMLLPTNMRRFPDYLAPALEQHGFRLRARVESASYALLKELVRGGAGVAIVPRIVSDGSLPCARIAEPRITRQVGWLEREGAPELPSRNTFRELLRARCREFDVLRPKDGDSRPAANGSVV
jgi:DNA-binding transcriptional LysR family regulator